MRVISAVCLAGLAACSRAADPVDAVLPDSQVQGSPAYASIEGEPSPLPSWELVGRQGVARFIVLREGDPTQEETFRVPMAESCGLEPVCHAHFWTSDNDAARRLPMTDSQLAARVGLWQRNLNTGLNRLLLPCKLGRSEAGECL